MSNEQYQLIRHDGVILQIGPQGATIGRNHSNDIVVPGKQVSRQHARILLAAGKCWIRDENSALGVFVNGKRVQGQQELKLGEVLQIGNTNFRLTKVKASTHSDFSTGNVFISYAREEQEFVRRLFAALSTDKRETWVDWEKIPPTADWWEEICLGIESADNFIFIISPNSIQSKVCKQELEHAVKNNKRLIPVVYNLVSDKLVPDVLRSINWIFFHEVDKFNKSFQSLLVAIDTDLDWVKQHTNLVAKSNEWVRKNRNSNLLLRGTELENAESWLNESNRQRLMPTDLIVEYISTSRQYAKKVKRNVTLLSITTSIVLIVIASVAYSNFRNFQNEEIQRKKAQAETLNEASQKATAQAEAINEKSIAMARSAAAQASSIFKSPYDSNTDPVIGILLAIESLKRHPTLEGDQAIRSGLTQVPYAVLRTDHSDTVNSISFSPDGLRLATADGNGSISVIELSSGRELLHKDNGGSIGVVVYSPEGNWLAYNGIGGRVEVVDPITGNEQMTFYHNSSVDSIRFSPDGRYLVTSVPADSCDFSQIIIWDLSLGTKETEIPSSGYPSPFTFSADGKWLAIAENGCSLNESKISVWDFGAKKVISTLDASYTINDLDISPDKRWLAVGTSNPLKSLGGLDIYELNLESPSFTGYKPLFSQKYWNGVSNVEFGANGKWLALSNDVYSGPSPDLFDYSTIQVWQFDPDKGELSNLISRIIHDEDIKDLESSADSRQLAAGTGMGDGNPGKSMVWLIPPHQSGGNLIQSQRYQFVPIDMTNVEHMVIGPKGNALGASRGGFFTEWDLINEKKVNSVDRIIKHSLAVSPDGTWIAANIDNGVVKVFEVYSDNEILQIQVGETITSVGLSTNGKWLVIGDNSNRVVQVWGLESLEEIVRFEVNDIGEYLTISPDGIWIAINESETLVNLWEVNTGKKSHTLVLDYALNDMAFSWDSNKLAIASGFFDYVSGQNFTNHSDKVQVWDVITGEELSRINHHETTYSVAFSPYKNQIISQSGFLFTEIGNFWSWMIEPSDLIHQACLNANRNMNADEWGYYFPGEDYQPTCLEP